MIALSGAKPEVRVDLVVRPMSAANHLAARLGRRLRRVYVEALDAGAPPPTIADRVRASRARLDRVLRRPPREPEIFGPFVPIEPGRICSIPHRDFSRLVEDATRDPPDLLVLLGASLVPSTVIRLARRHCLNIHLGLAPRYRGLFTTHWAVLLGELDQLGVTLHEVSEGVDSGAIVAQARPALLPRDDLVSIELRLMAEGIALIGEVVAGIEAGRKLAPRPQGPGRLFRRRDFSPVHLASAEALVRSGAIRRYCEDHEPARRIDGPYWQ